LIPSIPSFNGFVKDSFKFLKELESEKNNNTKWFAKNRARYDDNLVTPAKSFIKAIGQFFNHLNPSIRTEPKFNKTIMRINKDMRFSKGVPYKTFFLIHFGRFKMDSEFFVYLDSAGLDYGLFLNNTQGDELFFGENITRYRKEIVTTLVKYKINRKFDLYKMDREPEFVLKKFDGNKHIDKLEGTKYIILQKHLEPDSKLIYSPNFLTEAIKTYSLLYPLYCFCISADPLKLVDDFDERMGIPVQ
jgi:uncharacterized protein (DUF2461 family)